MFLYSYNEGFVYDNGAFVQGFPRNDIDLVSVTADRRQVKELSNDHKLLMGEIERKLHKLHAQTRGEEHMYVSPPQHTREQSAGQAVVAPIAVPATSVTPFAVVDLVFENSPSMIAGLKEDDEIIRCAHITSQTPNSLETMGSLVSESEDRELDIVIQRGQGEVLALKLTPKKWSGRGLLGCHLQKKH